MASSTLTNWMIQALNKDFKVSLRESFSICKWSVWTIMFYILNHQSFSWTLRWKKMLKIHWGKKWDSTLRESTRFIRRISQNCFQVLYNWYKQICVKSRYTNQIKYWFGLQNTLMFQFSCDSVILVNKYKGLFPVHTCSLNHLIN